MGNVRLGRVNEEMLRVLSGLLRTIKDPRVGGLVSVTHVEAAPDFHTAKVFVSALGDENVRRDCMKGLASASGYLRRELAGAMRLRYTPELVFVEDDSITTGTHIMELINGVAREEEKKKNLDVSRAAAFLQTRDDILILTHKSPDGDAAGSAAALCLILSAAGKRAYVFKNPEFTDKLKKLTRPLAPPSDFTPRCIIAVDCADKKLLSKGAEEYADDVALAIDHHETHRPFASLVCVDSDAAACGEVIFDIAEAFSAKLTKKLCTALYIAISTDTGCFMHRNTTAETHRKAAVLFEHGVDFVSVNREYFVEKSRARIELEAKLISDMNFYFDGRVSVIRLTAEMISDVGATEDDLENMSEIARRVSGVELGIYIREREGGVKASMRSGNEVNAAELCAHFGGGGHAGAAGCAIDLPVDAAERAIIDYIEETGVFA